MWTCRNAALALLLTLLSTSVFAQGAFLAGTPTPQATSLTAIPASARIVFHTNQVIYTMDAAGGNITQITYVPGRALDHIAVSPDRKRVVASYVLDGLEKLVLFDLDAGTEVLLVPYFYRAGYGGVDWDLAGNIYFVGIEDLPYPNPTTTAENQANAAAFDVYRVKYDGTQVQRITSTTDHGEADVSVSADGTLITYVSSITTGGTTSEVWTNTIAGTAPHLVYNEPLPTTRNVHDPELSPDNTKVVFSRVNPAFHNFPAGPNTAHDLYKINVNGTGLTLITTPGPISILPDWKDTSIVYLELSDEAVDYLGVSTISDTGTGKVRINGNAASPKWIETATVPAVPPPSPAAPPPANLRVQKLSWSVYPNPANDAAIVTAAAYLGNTTGEATAMAKLLAAGGDVAPRYLKWRDVEANLGVYDFTKIDALVATSGELPLVVNFAPIWDDGSTSIPTGLAFTTFGDPAVVLAYQNMLTAAVAHLKGRLYALIVGSEVDTYLTTDSRRAQYAAFLQQVRGFARTKFGTNPFLVTTSLRSTVTSTWADWAGIASVVDLNAFTYYPDSTPETFGPRIVADLQHFAALGPFMLLEVGISVTGIGEDVQSAEMQALTGIIGVIADTSHRIPIVIFAGLSDVSAAVLADFGYSSGQLTAGMGLRTTANAGKVGYVTLCGSFGGTNCADLVAPAPTCTFTLAAASDTFTAALGSDTVALTASDAGCAWTRQLLDGAPSWLTVTPASGTGSATITYSVTANTDTASRTVHFTIGDGDIFTITQAGATPPIDPDLEPDFTCTSTTASPTGRSPRTGWTPCRQDTFNRMYACYLLDPANGGLSGIQGTLDCGDGLGGKWAKYLIGRGGGVNYQDTGDWAAAAFQWTGTPTYAARSYAAATTYFIDLALSGHEIQVPDAANFIREFGVTSAIVYEEIYPAITVNQRVRFVDGMAAMLAWTEARDAASSPILGISPSDSDQIIGYVLAVAIWHQLEPSNSAITTLFNKAGYGGLAATGTDRSTLRNALKNFVTIMAASGPYGAEHFESGEYDTGTTRILFIGWDAMKTATGVDYYPEIKTFLKKYGETLIAIWTPDLLQFHQWGDEENPHSVDKKWQHTLSFGVVGGLLQGTDIGARLLDNYRALVAKYGAIGFDTMEPTYIGARTFLYVNPYAVSSNYKLGSPNYHAPGIGLMIHKSGFTASDSLFSSFHNNQPSSTQPIVDHYPYQWGDWQLWKNGEWLMTHPFGYAIGANPYLATTLVNGIVAMGSYGGFFEYKKNDAVSFSTDYAYHVATSGGSPYQYAAFGQPNVVAHEWTRETLKLDGAIDTVILYDRAHVENPTTSPTFATDYQYVPAAERTRMQTAPSMKQLIFHTPVLPTCVSGVCTWTTPTNSVPAKITSVFPVADTTTAIFSEVDKAEFTEIPYLVGVAERKYQFRTYPTTARDFDAMLNVAQFGASPGAITAKEDVGKVRGVHIAGSGSVCDKLVLFNSTPSAHLALPAYDASHEAALAFARFRGTGFGPIAWTAVGTCTDDHLQDLNPNANWTLNIDGAGANTITPDAAGHYRFSVSGAGSHTITVVGDGTGAPAACALVTLAPTTLPNGMTGSAYSQSIIASGVAGPFTYAVLNGTLPTSLALSGAGALTGTPTILGNFTFTVRATSGVCSGSQTYTVTVDPPAPLTGLQRAGTPKPFSDFTGSVNSVSTTVTVGAGSNGLGVVELAGGGTDLSPACILGGNAMTLIAKIQAPSDLWTYAFRRLNPAAGSNTLTCTFSSIPGTMIAGTFHGYINVDQTTPINVSATFSSASGTVVPGSLTTTRDDTWTVLTTRSWGSASAGLGSTAVASVAGLATFDAGPHTTPGVQTMEATYPSSALYGAIMFAINPAP